MPLVEAIVATRTTAEWLARLTGQGVPATPILTVDGVLADPQLRARQMVVEMRHPRLGPVPTLGTPIKVDGQLGLAVSPPPALGEHTDVVLRDVLKCSDERLADLRRAGVIH
jgi:crotonobetainyl-CoA:carnitine CoA-transferase CaiB-like acyl-CoA transferase